MTQQKTIKARLIQTGREVQVDDQCICFGRFCFYNMWHTDTDGNIWHDDDLEFLEERLQ